jgi:hypothetical protein
MLEESGKWVVKKRTSYLLVITPLAKSKKGGVIFTRGKFRLSVMHNSKNA